MRAVGELGRLDLQQQVLEQVNDQDSAVSFWAAWSAVLLGNRGKALSSLQTRVFEDEKFSIKSQQLVLRVLELPAIKELLKALLQNENRLRETIIGAGISGDPTYIPWLIKQMETPKFAKIAGESFSFITGVDIAYDDLDGDMPENYAAGPTENPEDEEVAMDADEDLACPDPGLIDRWWKQHEHDFLPGARYLLGKPVNEQQCKNALSTGKQRQRWAAALERVLMQPGTPLFETRAMGKRQQQWLLEL